MELTLPYVLRKEKAENDIFNAVNESAKKVPFCTLEDILTNLLHQVREQARLERDNALIAYEKEVEEYNRKEAEEEVKTSDGEET